MKDERQSSTELANKIQDESFESLVIDSISKCYNTREHQPDRLETEVADISVYNKEAHQVSKPHLHEDAQGHKTKEHRKVSLQAQNVASEFNVSEVRIHYKNIV